MSAKAPERLTVDYSVVMRGPRSIRFDESVTRRLASFVARHPGRSSSSVAARFVDEGLRMDEHPGVMFREGPAGRRATLVSGPDVWQIVRAVRSAREAEPQLPDVQLLDLVEGNTGVPVRLIRTALDYWSAYPDEVDAMIEDAEQRELDERRAHERSRGLLSG